ncbi:hypothetical protein GBZ48_13230 [Azospirillum melinis]|uniref:HTH cro/C1-type domain-containing protein n=1 Tax=Azospirillum melinis TaxID=328839 RepID=A0ABX2KHW0_9PROT|nr:hypothetical protein [Azospirillum melinis]MBP2306310.1 putative XRE-type DNA-binding protein [Azospirillum melinis]NUB00250.1 hypothetical protein [Azospirillum melinis]
MTTEPRATFHLNIGTTLQEATRTFAEVWHRAEAGDAVMPAEHLDFPSWEVLAHALRDPMMQSLFPPAFLAAVAGLRLANDAEDQTVKAAVDSPGAGDAVPDRSLDEPVNLADAAGEKAMDLITRSGNPCRDAGSPNPELMAVKREAIELLRAKLHETGMSEAELARQACLELSQVSEMMVSNLNRLGIGRINQGLAVFGTEIKTEYRLHCLS